MKLTTFEMLAAVALGSSAVSASHSTYWPTFATVPTPKPTSPCSGSTPDWTDSAGDGCEWYEAFDRPGCPVYGDDYGTEERGVANDNCCYCEGTGAPIASPAPTPWPTYDPAATWSPTPDWDFEEPRRPCEGSTPDWKDVDGYGCEWYEAYDMPGCPFYGQDFGTEEGGVADDHCCFCEGTGSPLVSPANTPWPTYSPYSLPPTEAVGPTPKQTSPCTGNTLNWVDVYGDGCEWYEAFDVQGCLYYGHEFGTEEGGVAKDNCCFCAL